MSRHSSGEKRDQKGKSKSVFSSGKEAEEECFLSIRKRSERQASQGVKVLVNREKGINSDMSISVESESSIAQTQEVRRVLPINPSPHMPAYPTSSIPKNYGNYPSGYSHPQMSHPQRGSKEHIILNIKNFEKLVEEKMKKEHLGIQNPSEFLGYMNLGLEAYLKSVLEKLISIGRIRNVNLNLYSKQSEKNPTFKIHTMNLDRPSNTSNEIVQNSYKDFSIVFTRNMKLQMNMLEQYEELNLKKLRQDRVTLYKTKLEEISNLKEKEKEEKASEKAQTVTTASTKPKQRVRKRDSMLKNVRNTLAKSQKRDEMARHKKETQNTLETFLDNKPKPVYPSNLSGQRMFDSEMVSNIAESHNYETFTKMSEISKSEMQGTIAAEGSHDINLTIFKHHTPSQNVKLPPTTSMRRRITLKDLIQFLEGERRTPLQNLILHKAIVKLNQYSH